jgi:hypothetical protein
MLFNKHISLHAKSCYSWQDFLEKEYFEIALIHVKDTLGENLNDYFFEFYLHKKGFLKSKLACSNTQAKKKVLFILGDEHNEIQAADVSGYDKVFKTYLSSKSAFIPLPIGYNSKTPLLPKTPLKEREFDIFFSGNLNENRLTGLYKSLHPLRFLPSRLFVFLFNRPGIAKLFGIRFPNSFFKSRPKTHISFTDGFNSGLSPASYADYLNASKFVICPKGFVSTETFRLYEALRQGCMVICEQLPSHEFYVDAPFIVVKDWNNFRINMKEQNLIEISSQSAHFYEQNLSELATANYIIKNIIN